MILIASASVAAFAAGCGSSASSSSAGIAAPQPAASGTATASASSSNTTSTSAAAGALSAEAQSAATGDIPDTQVFLTFTNPTSRYSISYPEGWTRKGAGNDVTFSDKNNIVHIVIAKAAPPTPAGVASELNGLKKSNPTLTFTPPVASQVKAGRAVKATYTTQSAPNPVTGKSVLLIVDRYELSRGGMRATVDLATPKGVDNVDAYRLIINSLRWK
jgi:hypothetical protein